MEDTAPTVTNDNVSKDVPATPTKYRSSAYRGNARGLGKHEKQTGEDNYTMLQGFEWHSAAGGQFWNEFKKKTSELGSMGITAVWLPPPTKASSPEGNGYDIYDLYDLGEFETYGGDNKSKATKWGTKEEYINAIEEAKKNGMVVYVDAVLNHKAGADTKEKFMATEVDSEDRTKEISDCYEIEGWTGFHFPGRGDKYSEMKWHHYHFTGVDYDARGEKTAIFKIQGEGKDWAEGVDKEKGSFDYLMFSDIDHSHPEVIADLEKWGEWILKETGAGGFRFDAIKHIDETFCSNFVKAIRERLDNEDVFAVGEFWLDNVAALTGYLDRFDTQFSIFDTPLHYNFAEASSAGASFDLRKIFDGSLVQARPMDAVTIVDNHDTQPGEALESFVGSGFKPLAYSLILFRNDGYPCVFEGDLYGCKSDPPVEPMHQLSDFIRIRKLFTYGATRDYWDHPNCVGWVREGDKDHDGCAIVICNGTGEGEKRMQIPDGHAGEIWTDVLGWFEGEVVIGEDGWADFKCPASSVSVWVNKDARGREEFRVGDMELEKGVEELKI